MTQNYTKTNDKTTDLCQDNVFFDNDLYEDEANLPHFKLERLARRAAQRIIQEVLEAEFIQLQVEKWRKDWQKNC